jgi:RNA ligase
MSKLHEVLDVELLNKHLEDGVVRKQVHPLYSELVIYNYTEKAQFDRIWDEVTNFCRGFIVAGDEVLARGFNKFHNLNTEYIPETLEANLPKEIPEMTDKLDGSMGIVYRWDGQLWVATRGSFDSEQARWATQYLRNHYVQAGLEPEWPEGLTPVCEVIYAENRIVVSYDFEGLIFTGLVDNATGRKQPRNMLEEVCKRNLLPVVEVFSKTLAEAAAENIPNKEGYVLEYSNGVMVKVKFSEYVRLHRILTGLNPKAIWEMLAEGQDTAIDAILADSTMPKSFIEWFSGWVEQLRARYKEIEYRAQDVYTHRPIISLGTDVKLARKTAAQYFTRTPDLSSILFAMLDGREYAGIIWDKLKPKGNETFKKDGE